MRGLLLLAFSLVLAGCGSSQRSSYSDDPGPGQATTLIEADWGDIYASVDAVATRHALGVVRKSQSDNLATIELLDVLGRPIRIEARRAGNDAAVTVAVGRFGDPNLEAQIRRDLAKRLKQLKGVEIAPIAW